MEMMFITTRDVIYSSFVAPCLPPFYVYPRNIVLLDLIRTLRLHELLSDCDRRNKLTGACEIFIHETETYEVDKVHNKGYFSESDLRD